MSARAEHQAIARVAIVRNRDHVKPELALLFQISPQRLGIFRVERGVRNLRTFVGEDDAAMQVLKLRR